jgi:aryl-alcohol dehydrogenase-like predicted oxidoreductase
LADRQVQNKELSRIGIGGYALSGVYRHKDIAQFIRVVQRGYELGVTFFDVADVYGPAETVLGEAVAPFRDKVWVATKVGWGSHNQPDCSPAHIQLACEQSLRNLRSDYIDLYQIHFDDPLIPVEETVKALEQLKSSGKIRYYGVGHLPPEKMLTYFSLGKVFSLLAELSAVARNARQRTLPLCQAHQVKVIAFSPTGRGILTGKIGLEYRFEEGDIRHADPLFQRERFASGLRLAEKLKILGERYGKTPAQVAISWVLAQPGVVCALCGPSTISHLEENLGAQSWEIPADELCALEEYFLEEEAHLRQEQSKSLREILGAPLQPAQAFSDLVYAFETLIETWHAPEDELMPLFYKLWSIHEQQGEGAMEVMRGIQDQLWRSYSGSLNEE